MSNSKYNLYISDIDNQFEEINNNINKNLTLIETNDSMILLNIKKETIINNDIKSYNWVC